MRMAQKISFFLLLLSLFNVTTNKKQYTIVLTLHSIDDFYQTKNNTRNILNFAKKIVNNLREHLEFSKCKIL